MSNEKSIEKKDEKFDDMGFGGGINDELSKKLEELSTKETENLVKTFKEHFDNCTKACKKVKLKFLNPSQIF